MFRQLELLPSQSSGDGCFDPKTTISRSYAADASVDSCRLERAARETMAWRVERTLDHSYGIYL